jgi:hypothetical protein
MSLEKRLILRNGRAEYKHGEKGKKKGKESRMRGQSGGIADCVYYRNI